MSNNNTNDADNDQQQSKENNEDLLPGMPDHIKMKLIDLVKNLDNVENVINEIEVKSLNNNLHSTMNPLEIAKMNWISMYAINSLYFVYLKNTGITLKDHPLMNELGRIRSYMSRIKDIEEAEKNKIKNRIDKDSSSRIIKRSLWMNASKKTNKMETKNQDDTDDDVSISAKRINLNN